MEEERKPGRPGLILDDDCLAERTSAKQVFAEIIYGARNLVAQFLVLGQTADEVEDERNIAKRGGTHSAHSFEWYSRSLECGAGERRLQFPGRYETRREK